MTVFVLWEDHSDGPVDRFGPHVFLVACVADRLEVDRFELHRSETIRSRSCNGNSNVFRELGRSHAWNTAPHVIAVLDSDKLHELLGGEARKLVVDSAYDAWAGQMEARCRGRIDAHDADRLTLCFLDRNLETLLQTLGDTSARKSVVRRDKLLQRAASDLALIRRASEAMPSWGNSSIPLPAGSAVAELRRLLPRDVAVAVGRARVSQRNRGGTRAGSHRRAMRVDESGAVGHGAPTCPHP